MEPKRAVPMKAFLQAYRSLLEKRKDIILILAGPFKYIHERANKNIMILRNVPREKLPILYASADIFIFPTLYEGFGIPPLEAMACGTPVIAPSNSSLPEVVGDAGIYVENPLNPREWYDRINILLEDEGLRNYLSKKGIIRAHDFSWDKSAETLREIYETISRR
jgi:glycosyltransferase involved in cell wall biosynthesis